MPLREDQIRRYARHVLLPDVGGVGQERLLAAAVRVEVGPGAGAEIAALIYLAAAGVGTLVLGGDADGAVTEAEVATGIAYGPGDAGRPRREVLARRIAALNPDVRIAVDGEPVRSPVIALALDTPPPPVHPVADALVRGGAAASTLLHRLATSR
jgi:molybdopterin/thiamine biosynthesis adenylyltransferase